MISLRKVGGNSRISRNKNPREWGKFETANASVDSFLTPRLPETPLPQAKKVASFIRLYGSNFSPG